MYIWHNKNGKDQYYVCHKGVVLFKIPRFLGRWLKGDK